MAYKLIHKNIEKYVVTEYYQHKRNCHEMSITSREASNIKELCNNLIESMTG